MIHAVLYNPNDLTEETWYDLQAMERDALASAIDDRTPEDIDTLARMDDPENFMGSRLLPNLYVGETLHANQQFTRPKVAVALNRGDNIVGWAYSAHNVSGGGSPEGPHNISGRANLLRDFKRLSIVKNYLWLREVIVSPEVENAEAVADVLGRTLLKDAIRWQPVSAYKRPGLDTEYWDAWLAKIGCVPTGEMPVEVFGPGSEPVTEERVQAPTVRSALKRLG